MPYEIVRNHAMSKLNWIISNCQEDIRYLVFFSSNINFQKFHGLFYVTYGGITSLKTSCRQINLNLQLAIELLLTKLKYKMKVKTRSLEKLIIQYNTRVII